MNHKTDKKMISFSVNIPIIKQVLFIEHYAFMKKPLWHPG